MSEPKKSVSKEEMLEAIDEFINKEYPLSCAYSCLPALRALILAVEEWRKRANRALGDPDEKTLTRLLAEDIRDFGKEKNENPK